MIKSILTAAKSTTSQPISQPAPEASPEVTPEDILKAAPVTDQQLAEMAAKQVGYQPGDEVTGRVMAKKIPNAHKLLVMVPDWSEPVLCEVQNAADWSGNESIRCRYFKANAEGVLLFENRDGVRRNRWRR
jgi:hypothetical protein